MGRLFVHKINLKERTPRLHLAMTYEIDEPYRRSKSLVIRYGREGNGVVIGFWRNSGRTPDEALLDALQGDLEAPYQLVETEESIAEWYRAPLSEEQAEEVLEAARKRVARGATDIDDEWELLGALGLR